MSSITTAQTIKLSTKASIVSLIGAGPTTQTLDMVEQEYTVEFDGYSQGQQKVADGVAGVVIVNSANMVLIASDQPLNMTVTVGSSSPFTIPSTKRFSYQSTEVVKIELENASGTEANVDYITTTP
ncbi:hypothetical protein NVP1031O_141 [Vibrio phage 1.031.O._10N.261.46.F8]|nr:hypothetical protein NVP1031O_141 [Vibrio phage 1.031.O._10N.261.46.F8]